jgi:hypothetical protein
VQKRRIDDSSEKTDTPYFVKYIIAVKVLCFDTFSQVLNLTQGGSADAQVGKSVKVSETEGLGRNLPLQK